MTRTTPDRAALLAELTSRLGPDAVIRDRVSVARSLRDNSWLSPILTEHLGLRRQDDDSAGFGADAIVAPCSVDELRAVISRCVQFNCPMTLRGGGTTNFGQSLPLHGGVVVDVRRLNRVLEIGDDFITAESGALQADVNDAARARGREMTILPTTAASATLAGWVAGGHAGLGGPTYGTTWDNNVLGVKLLTAEIEPRELTLTGDDVSLVLRTCGTTGILTEVSVPLVPARRWLEAVVVFEAFTSAARFVQELSERGEIAQRSVSAQEEPLGPAFTPIRHLYTPRQAATVAIFDAAHEDDVQEIANRHGGAFHPWQIAGEGARFPLGFMAYGHRMLWVKKIAPTAAFLNTYFLPERVFEQFDQLKERFGADILLEMKYVRSSFLRRLRGLPPDDGLLPATLTTIVPGDREFVRSVMAFCDTIGVTYQNPHTVSIADSGVFPHLDRIVRFAREVDPQGLLNPGKLGATTTDSMTGAHTR